MVIKDFRVAEARTVISAIISKVLARDSEVLITGNLLVVIADKTLMFVTELKALGSDYNTLAFRFGDIEEFEDPCDCITDDMLAAKLLNSYNQYNGYVFNNPLLASDNDARLNETFEELLNLKTDDGMKFYRMIGTDMKEYLVPIFCGLINVSKGDGVGLAIYDLLDEHLLININISKKKLNRTVNMYFRTIKL